MVHPQSENQSRLPGLSGLSLYVPPYRVDLRRWAGWNDTDRERVAQVVGDGFRMMGPGQSVYTMAANAVLRLIQRHEVDPQRVRWLALGTESSTDNSAGAVIVKGMVDDALRSLGLPPLSRNCEVPEFKHACLGGVYAVKGALRYLATDGADSAAIVVCADKALYERGSSGEPTQGAGAVGLLLEAEPRLASIDLAQCGSAAEYRGVDFRKPLERGGNGYDAPALDIPVYNGRYSTNCYIDEVQRALEDMYRRRDLRPADYARRVAAVFMHRPYQRMPETGWGIAYLFALAAGDSADHEELARHCRAAGCTAGDVVREMRSLPRVHALANEQQIRDEAFPCTMATLKAFRQTEDFGRQVLSRMTLGTAAMREIGNLYTGALPAWLAAGLEEAAADGVKLEGREILTIGYGSGDAAEAMPMTPVAGWERAASRSGIADALDDAVDLDEEQYLALRRNRPPRGIAIEPADEFVVERIGHNASPEFQDVGVEYYRYVP